MTSIGDILRETRKKKGISEATAAKTIKLKLDRLQDLEENRYDQFPAIVYARSFLRHYAEYLAIDTTPILQKFDEEYVSVEENSIQGGPLLPQSSYQIPPSLQRSNSDLTPTGKTVVSVALLVISLAIVACIYWVLHTQPSSSNSTSRNSVEPILHPSSLSISSTPAEVKNSAAFDPSIQVLPLVLSTNRPSSEASQRP